jgi:Methyltransferase FkbM domain
MRRFLGKMSQNNVILSSIRSVFRTWFPKLFYFRSYSQWGEDSIISQFIVDNDWTYIDVGSSHPVHGNDTYFLYSRGCDGLLVDPIFLNEKLSRIHRPRDKFVLGIVGIEKNLRFIQFANSGISTADIARGNELKMRGNTVVAETYPDVYTLTDIASRLSSPDKKILLKIDVEGLELSVLKSLDFSRIYPELILVEELETLPNERTAIREFLEEQDYALIISGYNSHLFQGRRSHTNKFLS